MAEPIQAAARECEVAIVGAGVVGLTLAVGLARAGITTELIGPRGPLRPGRTVALLEGSVRLLEAVDLWRGVAAIAAPLASMRIVDATDSLFRSPPVQFDAAELGMDAFGYNVINDELEAELWQMAALRPDLGIVPAYVSQFTFGREDAILAVEGHGTTVARLVIAADGRQSMARKSARIGVRTRNWPQTALTALFRHDAPHGNTSVEFHTRQGPFTLVPLPRSDQGGYRSSLVWVMSPDEAVRRRRWPADFARSVEIQAGRLFGTMTLDSAVGGFPIATTVSSHLTAQRLALAGEAAHALPPIGAQGLNLSLRDVAALIEILGLAKRRGEDLGSAAVLDRYATLRRGDVATRTLAVDLLNGSLLARSPLADFARGAGLSALSAVGPLRRLAMRRGLVSQVQAD